MGSLTPAVVAGLARQAGIRNEGALTIAVAVAMAESGLNPTDTNNNTNGTTDTGLWQINSVHKKYTAAKLKDPMYNARAMFDISSGGTNWSPWSAYKNDRYKQHLAAASAAVIAIGGGGGQGLDDLAGAAVDAAGRVVPGAAGAVGDVLGEATELLGDAAGGAASLLGLDGIAKDVFTAGLGLVFSLGALVLVALGLSRLTGRSPAKTLQDSTADAKAAAGLLT